VNATQRRLRAQIAAHTRWSKCEDRRAATAKATAAFNTRFDDQVDPDRRLDPQERAKRAANARKAYFAKLALKRHN